MAAVTSSCRTGPPEVRRRGSGVVVMRVSLTRRNGCVPFISVPYLARRCSSVSFRRKVMKFLFDDESFSFEALRAAGFANYGGADLGEVLVAARAIPDGDEAAWHREWKAIAQRAEALGRESLQAGHDVSAREALLRASNYYRTAEFYRRDDPFNDPEVAELSHRSRDTFLTAIRLFDFTVVEVAIPYQDTTLPGYLYLVDDSGAARGERSDGRTARGERSDDSGTARPTVIYNSGYDSTLEESYFAIAAAALARGYNVLAFDGPGQGGALREQRLVFRPDWEAVVTPVIDFALTRPEIKPDAIALFGYSLGGYLVARAAAFEHRVAAIVLDDGVFDFSAAFRNSLPPFLSSWISEGRDDAAVPVLTMMAQVSLHIRWAMNNGIWAMGAR